MEVLLILVKHNCHQNECYNCHIENVLRTVQQLQCNFVIIGYSTLQALS